MNKKKVRDFCTAYAKATGASDYIKNVVIELMENIITKYEKTIGDIPVRFDECAPNYVIKPTGKFYSIEDFFLNRLINNIVKISEIDKEDIDIGIVDEGTKGQFVPDRQEVSLNEENIDKQLNRFRSLFGDNFEKVKERARKKVVMHEFEHGLKTRYNGYVKNQSRDYYIKFYQHLPKEYDGIIRKIDEIPPQNWRKFYEIIYYSTGCHMSRDAKNMGIMNYRNATIPGISETYSDHVLDEILNESESIEMANSATNLWQYCENSENDSYFISRNPESSNNRITNYGDLLKIILGDRYSFMLMYLKPEDVFPFFNNKYNDIFQQEYGYNADAISILLKALTDINSKGNEEDHLKLCAALSKCFARNMEEKYSKGTISRDKAINLIHFFRENCLTNQDENKRNNMEHMVILQNLEEKANSLMPVAPKEPDKVFPSFEELKRLSEKYDIVAKNDDILVKDINTGKIVDDSSIKDNAIFANIWLLSAGLKWFQDENKKGERYAFNDKSKELYEFFVKASSKSLREKGKIDTLAIFEDAEFLNDYKYNQETIVNLFRNDSQTEFIEKFFKDRVKTDKNCAEKAKPLYNYSVIASMKNNMNPKGITGGTK